jgi:hypothetical protein
MATVKKDDTLHDGCLANKTRREKAAVLVSSMCATPRTQSQKESFHLSERIFNKRRKSPQILAPKSNIK